MRKISFLVLVGILAFSLESCSFMSKFAEKSVDTVVEDAKKDIQQANKTKNSRKKESLAPKVEKVEEVEVEEKVVGLIPATQPEIRVRGSIRGRQDPFAIVAIKPQIEIIEQEEKVKPAPPTARKTEDIDIDSVPVIEEELPVAELAENVLVTGLIEFGDRIKLIVQAPEETSTRYVEIGQYLSNGQILVKRLEPGFPSPTVILEENGIEVAKVVGQLAEGSSEDGSISFSPVEQESVIDSLSWLSN